LLAAVGLAIAVEGGSLYAFPNDSLVVADFGLAVVVDI